MGCRHCRLENRLDAIGLKLDALAHQVDRLQANAATLRALTAKLKASSDALAASVAANSGKPKPKSPESLSGKELVMDPLTGLSAQVDATNGVQASAKVLIDGFAAKLAAAGTDPAKLQALQDSLKANSDALAASVAANP